MRRPQYSSTGETTKMRLGPNNNAFKPESRGLVHFASVAGEKGAEYIFVSNTFVL